VEGQRLCDYTSVGATARNYTVVVPVDAAMARTDYETGVGIFQTLNQADSNPTNQPLKRKATTISRTDLITIPVRLVRAA